jgi:hypothetical protein
VSDLNGLKGYPFAIIEHPVANNDDGVLKQKAQAAMREIVPMLLARKS